jgi:hypothetical protein
VLIFPTVMEDSVFYIISSETAEDSQIDIRDRLTGARLHLRLAAQHSALAVISKKTKAVVAKFGF